MTTCTKRLPYWKSEPARLAFEGEGKRGIGTLSKDVFEQRTSTGSEALSLFICLDANKLVLLSFFSLLKTIYPRVSSKPLPNDAKSPLPVDVRRSKTLFLKLPNMVKRERDGARERRDSKPPLRAFLLLLVFLKVLRFSFPVPVVSSRSLVRFWRRKHKKSTTRASRP